MAAEPLSCVFFFFQAEDGIRDLTVTGVQTCALPIYLLRRRDGAEHHGGDAGGGRGGQAVAGHRVGGGQIGRGAGRGRGEISGGGGSLKKKKREKRPRRVCNERSRHETSEDVRQHSD